MAVSVIDTGYRPRAQQDTVHRSPRRFRVVLGHRRIGKTHLGLNELVDKGLRNMRKNPQYAYIAPTYGQAKRIAWDPLKDYTKNIPGVEVNESELRVDIPRPFQKDRIRIMLLGAENPASILGMYLDGVVFDEYGDMNAIVWTQVVRPLLSDRLGWAMFIGTPKGQNHFFDLYEYAKSADDWEAFIFKASETGIIPKAELEQNRAIMSESEYMQEFECFVPGTLVATSKGSVKIEDLRVGDVALTHRNRFHIITRTMSKDYNGKLLKINHYGTSEPLLVTKEHPFLVYTRKGQKREWVKAEDLNNTMYLVTPKLSKKMPKVNHSSLKQVFPTKFGIANRIISIKEQEYCGKVHNISVKQDESYVAGGVAVHNCSFAAALVGAYYGREMEWLEQNGKISTVPVDPSLSVWTAWDLGIDDTTAIWFVQIHGREIRVVDYLENSGAGLDYYVKELRRRDYTYDGHILPHDVKVRELSDGKSRLEKLGSMGIRNIKVAPKLSVADGIEAVRTMLKKCWFDISSCERGIKALRNYERKYDARNKIFQQTPLHNWASHGADAFRTLAVGLREDMPSDLDKRKYPRQTDSDYSLV